MRRREFGPPAHTKHHFEPGIRFGMLVSVYEVQMESYQQRHWMMRCDCGKEKVIRLASMTQGITRSCGCQGRANAVQAKTGDRYGDWTIIEELPRFNGRRMIRVVNDAGLAKDTDFHNLRYSLKGRNNDFTDI